MSGEPLWLESHDDHVAQFPLFHQQIGVVVPLASVAVPLRHDGTIVGALAIVFADSSSFGAVKQAFTLLLAQAAADELSRARRHSHPRHSGSGCEDRC